MADIGEPAAADKPVLAAGDSDEPNGPIEDLDLFLERLAPGMAAAAVAAAAAHSAALGLENAVTRQQADHILGGAALVETCLGILRARSPEAGPREENGRLAELKTILKETVSKADANAESGGSPGAGPAGPAGAAARTAAASGPRPAAAAAAVPPGPGEPIRELTSQAAAIVIEDAVDMLRQASVVANCAAGAAFAAFLETGDPGYLAAVTAANEMVFAATGNFSEKSQVAAMMLELIRETAARTPG